MTLTISLPDAAEIRLEQESALVGLSVAELAAHMLLQQMNLAEPYDPILRGKPPKPIAMLIGTVIRYDDPFGPAADFSDWEAAAIC